MTYQETTELISEHLGKRVRLTSRNGYQTVGVAAARSYGGDNVEFGLQGHFGSSCLHFAEHFEVMGDKGRYEVIR